MPVVTAKVNLILLNRGADLFFWGENVAAPLGCVAAKDLAVALDAMGDDTIEVKYRTISDPKEQAKDEKKFTKRLAGLGAGWVRSEWRTKTINGYVMDNTMVCTITRAS